MSRRVLVCAAVALVFASPAAAADRWAQPQIKLVAAHGPDGRNRRRLPAGRPAHARASSPTSPRADRHRARRARRTRARPPRSASSTPQLVRALGLLPAAREFPPASARRPRTARRLRHRGRSRGCSACASTTRPRRTRWSSARPTPATRAEAAYSAARILCFAGWETDWVTSSPRRSSSRVTTASSTTSSRRRSPSSATPTLGRTSERPQAPFATGKQVPGGFDCSGFVWRVYKLQPYAGARALAATLKGRTTYAMSGEVRRAERISARTARACRPPLLRRARPGRSRPRSTTRASISATAGSSTRPKKGSSSRLLSSDWYAKRFAWGRRPLAEAGLS